MDTPVTLLSIIQLCHTEEPAKDPGASTCSGELLVINTATGAVVALNYHRQYNRYMTAIRIEMYFDSYIKCLQCSCQALYKTRIAKLFLIKKAQKNKHRTQIINFSRHVLRTPSYLLGNTRVAPMIFK